MIPQMESDNDNTIDNAHKDDNDGRKHQHVACSSS
jgi:hypothetical protein